MAGLFRSVKFGFRASNMRACKDDGQASQASGCSTTVPNEAASTCVLRVSIGREKYCTFLTIDVTID
jgi:hypothetical protein